MCQLHKSIPEFIWASSFATTIVLTSVALFMLASLIVPNKLVGTVCLQSMLSEFIVRQVMFCMSDLINGNNDPT